MAATTTTENDAKPATVGGIREMLLNMLSGDKNSDAPGERVESSAKTLSNNNELSEAVKNRLINSELKAEARKIGLDDMDMLKLIDRSKLRVTNDDVEGIEAALAELKASKPNLFRATSTSSGAVAPKAGASGRFDATTATPEQIKKRLAELSGRQR